jgi:uncharacterized NAD(P)/FAD-binding protein YdhS
MDFEARKEQNCGNFLCELTRIVSELMRSLPDTEQLQFQNRWGMDFTRLIRRAGHEYAEAAQTLLDEGRLSVCKGELIRLVENEDSSVSSEYAVGNEETFIYPKQFAAVINCSGFEEPSRQSSSYIIGDLISQRICSVNSSGRGFRVNERLEAQDRLYVVGPLLAGIFNSKLKGWHMETARRIRPAATQLAETLGQVLLAS